MSDVDDGDDNANGNVSYFASPPIHTQTHSQQQQEQNRRGSFYLSRQKLAPVCLGGYPN